MIDLWPHFVKDLTIIDTYDIDISIELELSFPSMYNLAVLHVYSGALNSPKSIACYPTKMDVDRWGQYVFRRFIPCKYLQVLLVCETSQSGIVLKQFYGDQVNKIINYNHVRLSGNSLFNKKLRTYGGFSMN